jgi:uncharacterized membrane protein
MYSKAKIFGHPIHPMIVNFPITFYTVTWIAFGVYHFVNRDFFWYHLAYFSNMAGIVTAALAAAPGMIDWAFPKNTKAKSRGLLHMGLNVGALLLFLISALRIWGTWNTPIENVAEPFLLSFVGVVLTTVAGYHGWELVARHKVGVMLTPEQERIEPVEETTKKEQSFPGKTRAA